MADQERKVLINVEVTAEEAIKNIAAAQSAVQKLRTENKELSKNYKENSEVIAANNIQIKNLQASISASEKVALSNTATTEGSTGAYRKAELQLAVLRQKAKDLALTYGEMDERTIKASNDAKELSDKLKDVDTATGLNVRRVGDYKDQIIEAVKELTSLKTVTAEMEAEQKKLEETNQKGSAEYKLLSKAIEDNKSQITKLEGGSVSLSEKLDSVGGAGGQVIQTVKGMGTAFKALIVNPIVAVFTGIVGVATLLWKAFNRNEESGNKLNAVFSRVTGIFNLLLEAIEPVAEFIADKLIVGFDFLGKVASGTINLISKGLGLLGFDNAAKSVDNFNMSLSNASKESEKLSKMESELKNEQRKAQRVQLDYQRNAEKLRQLRDNESKSIPERIKANKELGAVLRKQMNAELSIAQKALNVANLRIKIEGATTENLDAQAEALNKISDIQERITGQQSEQLQNENSLRKEAADKRKEIAEKNAKAELDIENTKSQSIINKQNEIVNNEKSSYQERLDALSKSEAEQIKIINRNRDAELKQEGLTAKERQSIRAKASEEIVNLKSETEKSITDLEAKELEKRLKNSADNLSKKKQQLSDEQQAELVKLAKDFANSASKAKTEKEFTDLSKKYEKDKFDIAQKYREADFNAGIAALTAELNLYKLSAEQRAEIEKQIAETKNKYAQESAQIAIQASEKIVETETSAAQKRKELEQQLSDKKKELTQQLLTTISDITGGYYEKVYQDLDEEKEKTEDSYAAKIQAAEDAGKDTTALEEQKQAALDKIEDERKKKEREKAIFDRLAAIFNIGLSTGQAIMKSIAASPLTAGQPFVTIDAAMAALQIASILAQPLPKASQGMLLKGPSHSQGGIPIEAEGGEVVINKRSSAKYMGLLSAINEAGGGVKFGSGGIVGSYMFSDGGYAARNYNSNDGINKKDIDDLKTTIKNLKIYATIEDIRKSDKNYVTVESRANF